LTVATTSASVGRARLIPSQRAGLSAREEILEAAGRLFAENGYAATSTRGIALAVGIKQASLYYHFASKEDILARLLAGTVEPSLAFSSRISRSRTPPHVQLYALAHFDVSLLSAGTANVGALYQLPELRADRFSEFRHNRRTLQDAYGRRIVAGMRSGVFTQNSSLRLATELVFALAESVISIRANRSTVARAVVPVIAEGCLRLLSCSETDIAAAAAGAADLLG
jgi:AcrR family transcriptional regulator